jgi:hypothetical protein
MMALACLHHPRRQDVHHLCISRHPLPLPHVAPTILPIMTAINQRPVQHLTCTHFRTHTNTEPPHGARPRYTNFHSTRLPALKTTYFTSLRWDPHHLLARDCRVTDTRGQRLASYPPWTAQQSSTSGSSTELSTSHGNYKCADYNKQPQARSTDPLGLVGISHFRGSTSSELALNVHVG